MAADVRGAAPEREGVRAEGVRSWEGRWAKKHILRLQATPMLHISVRNLRKCGGGGAYG